MKKKTILEMKSNTANNGTTLRKKPSHTTPKKNAGASKIIKPLTELEQKLAILMINTEESFVLLDTQLKIVAFNHQFKKEYANFFGKEIQQGESILEYAQPQRLPEVKKIYKKVLDGGGTSEAEIEITSTNQSRHTYFIKYKPACDEQGTIIGVFVTIKDITQRKIAEQDKEFERHNLEALINNTNDLMWSVDKDFKLISANQPFYKLIKEISGQALKPGETILVDGFSGEQLKRYREFYERAFAGETFTELEHSGSPNDPWVEISFYPIRKRDSIIGTACHSRDITEKIKAEKSIKEERILLRTLVDNLPLNVYTKDIQSRLTLANRAECEYIGAASEEEILGKNDEELHSAESAKLSMADDHEVFATGHSIIGKESYHVTKNGTGKWYLKSKIPLRNEFNKINGLLGISYDITERKKTEDNLQRKTDELMLIKNELERSEKSLKEAQVMAHLGSWEFDLVTYVAKWSDEAYEILGLKTKSTVPSLQAFLSFIHPDDLELVKEIIQIGERSYDGHSFNCRIIRPDGLLRYIYADCRFILDREGKPLRMRGIIHDITERYKAEEKMRHSESRLKQAQAIAHMGSWEMSLSTNRGLWSDEACRIYGLSPGENIQSYESWLSFIHPEDLDYVKKETEKSWTTLAGSSFYHRIIRRDGAIRHIYTESKFEFNQDGRPVGIHGIAQDVTEWKHNEQELKILNEQIQKRAEELTASNAELERFAYVASHDLQEPLRMVSSFLQLLQKKYDTKLDETAIEYIGFAVDGADRMKKLIADLLEYSRIGTNRDKFTNTDMGKVVNDVLNMFTTTIQSTNAVVTLQPMPVIKANSSQMTQLVQNLIGNAFKYNKSAVPAIEVGCEERGDAWQFFVKDNGIGIEQKYFDKVFAIFQRLHNKNQFSGTGIGLAISKKIVEKHGGNIWIESVPGEGSSFFFTIKK